MLGSHHGRIPRSCDVLAARLDMSRIAFKPLYVLPGPWQFAVGHHELVGDKPALQQHGQKNGVLLYPNRFSLIRIAVTLCHGSPMRNVHFEQLPFAICLKLSPKHALPENINPTASRKSSAR
ncbi:hypothetical protein PS689_03170 [Pseudomonas fluorescens]|nr:hypothetical protein PS689_03170 [Pseudomonas fluorescens]